MTSPVVGAGGAGFKSLPALPWDYLQVAQGDPGLPNPAAGAPFIYTVPADTMLEFIHCEFTFITTGAAGNRLPHLWIRLPDGRTLYYASWAGQQAPGIGYIYYYDVDAPAMYSVASGGGTLELHIPVPQKLIITPGCTVESLTTVTAAPDIYTTIYMVFRKYTTLERLSWT